MTHQGFIGSLGTSAMLVGAAVAILLIVGAIVTFEGFPGPSVDDSTQPFGVGELGGSGRPEPELVLAPSAADSDAAAEVALAAAAEAASVDSGGGPAPPPGVDPTGRDTPPVPPEVPPVGDSPPGGSGGGGSGGEGLVASLRETVRDTTRVLESSVRRILPPGGDSVLGRLLQAGR